MGQVFILDGRSRAALSIVRSLGRKGFDITLGEEFKSFSFYSKFVKKKIIYPSPSNKKEFLNFILNYIANNKVDLIIPVRDQCTEIISNNLDQISKYTKCVVPPIESFNIARDKEKTLELCRKLSIPHPKSVLSSEINGSLDELKKIFSLPIVIKPRISSGSRGIQVVNNWSELKYKYQIVSESYPNPIIQEFIPHGGAYGVSLLFNKGNFRAFFTHKRLREYPISGGPSTLSEGVRFPEIETYAIKLLEELKWHGVAMVEFRIDKRNNNPLLMEINPRFWGSLETAIFSGVDFPYLLYELAMLGDCEEIQNYQLGKKVRWLLFGDILWFLSGRISLPKIKEFVKFKQKDLRYNIFSLEDFGPVYGIFYESIKSLFNIKRLTHVLKRGW
ncbi:ATP-grasp domain-containing protein [Melioribacter sp. Ez-97]|uniref:carboxylate--amine ligase n=1 Tax=Melioribacter sp. Ez-97 TaxID=3423434 RepID=UPI003ED89839